VRPADPAPKKLEPAAAFSVPIFGGISFLLLDHHAQ
jgi:hypothetical protein